MKLLLLFAFVLTTLSAQDAKVFLLTPEESKEAQDAYKAAKDAAKHYTALKAKLKEKYQFDFEILFSDDFKAMVPSDSQEPWYRGLGPCVIPNTGTDKAYFSLPIPATVITQANIKGTASNLVCAGGAPPPDQPGCIPVSVFLNPK